MCIIYLPSAEILACTDKFISNDLNANLTQVFASRSRFNSDGPSLRSSLFCKSNFQKEPPMKRSTMTIPFTFLTWRVVSLALISLVYSKRLGQRLLHLMVFTSSLIRQFIIKKTGWSEDQVNSIEWDSYAKALKSLSASGQVNWIKLAHDWQNTGHQKNLFNEIPTKGECLFHCGREESAMHFCECTVDPFTERLSSIQEPNK